jgi:hypothetical protein
MLPPESLTLFTLRVRRFKIDKLFDYVTNLGKTIWMSKINCCVSDIESFSYKPILDFKTGFILNSLKG